MAELADSKSDAGVRADRILKLAALLQAAAGETVTAEALAEALGVSARTIYRDIDTLRANGWRITGAAGVGYALAGAPRTPPAQQPAVARLAPQPGSAARERVRDAFRADEARLVAGLAAEARLAPEAAARVRAEAARLVDHVRENRRNEGGIDRFMHEYALSSDEGVALMCLAEALLRIPDAATQDALIEDKVLGPNWASHLGKADSLFVNASTLGLMVSGEVLRLKDAGGLAAVVGRLVRRSGEPVIRAAIRQAMRILGRQFVMGRTIAEALKRAKAEAPRYRMSFDMLGEAAYTDADALRYRDAYLAAIRTVGAARRPDQDVVSAHGVSVKLSALHPRYEAANPAPAMGPLYDRLLETAEAAARAGVGLCIDAEEAERLDLSLDLFSRLAHEPSLKGWDGLGLAVQAYQRRARPLVDWLAEQARSSGRRFLARLVKGAYWDTEIKRAQEAGLADFPVFTRKAHTDVSYLACARALFAHGSAFYPCFATHNAQTLAAVRELSGGRDPRGPEGFEFQRLHGMGGPLYEPLVDAAEAPIPCRIYAPVGGHEELLAYLVRRLLENGANSSFVNRITDDALPVDDIIADPVETAARSGFQPHPKVTPPGRLFGARANSRGLDLADPREQARLGAAVAELEKAAGVVEAAPITTAKAAMGASVEIRNPANRAVLVGRVAQASPALARAALEAAHAAQPAWNALGGAARADILERAADLYEADRDRLMRLCVREAGKTWRDAAAEVREAVDFLRYYAAEARRLFGEPTALPGPTGERNHHRLEGRGAFLCISPWNFPLAIFTGQVAAALAAGDTALAKPAEATPLIAHAAVTLLRRAGVAADALHLLPGSGPDIGAALLADPRLAGVAFTGSTATAKRIARALAERDGPIAPLIAETGGLNAMIADSSALPEQVTRDVVASAFQSAGQRCSAARVLYIQEEAAERQIAMIKGAMAELSLGDPAWLSTDVGPVIDAAAKARLDAHAGALRAKGRLIAEAPTPDDLDEGAWVAPQMYRIDGIHELAGEVFGPILHVATWKAGGLDAVVDAINASGYGLTLGLHSRIESVWRRVAARARVGNLYVNRNQIGAVVGSQPFGGEGLSGSGPKAGGPLYLPRFAVERVTAIDVTAQGGDAELMSLEM